MARFRRNTPDMRPAIAFTASLLLLSFFLVLVSVVVRKIYINFYNFSEVSRLRMMGTIGVILLLLVMWLLAHGVWTDMWLYSLSFLLILTLLLVLIFTVRRYWLNRKGRRHGTV